MRRYFPFLRGKLNEMMALRELAERIARRANVVPIIEPVKNNGTTRISLDRFEEAAMPFLLICNPVNGEYAGRPTALFNELIQDALMESENWTPALIVRLETPAAEIRDFLQLYSQFEVAIIYSALPAANPAQTLLADTRIINHVFLENRAGTNYINSIPLGRRVMIADKFVRQPRNADYPAQEPFTDMNTLGGNPQRVDFGDYSIVGDYYSDDGGPAYAVALHHIHFRGNSGPLYISHFISDRTDTTADTPGKILEALAKLVAALPNMPPNNTDVCNEYRQMNADGNSRGLGYMKKLAIKHHLEVMLDGGIQL